MFSNSTVLRAHFMADGYKPDTVAGNMPINGGLLLFRGSDAKDRTTMLILQGTIAKGEKDQNVLTPTGLVLFYVADAKTPDVHRLAPGSFQPRPPSVQRRAACHMPQRCAGRAEADRARPDLRVDIPCARPITVLVLFL
ncbi:MAG: hypothetical protein K2Z80_17415 [Xanthobacteraceae bacterium]|nr:hypothetical protein [Xanthobacteraceae bacterium]